MIVINTYISEIYRPSDSNKHMAIRDIDPAIVKTHIYQRYHPSDINKHMNIRDIDLVIVVNTWISEIST